MGGGLAEKPLRPIRMFACNIYIYLSVYLSWYLSKMVAQNMLRTYEVK